MSALFTQSTNLFDALPTDLPSERFQDILNRPGLRIERIVSKGHTTPADSWYDQDEHEWVMVVEGQAILRFEQGGDVVLKAGDYINIPAHCRHQVLWTDPEHLTVWLAVFYR